MPDLARAAVVFSIVCARRPADAESLTRFVLMPGFRAVGFRGAGFRAAGFRAAGFRAAGFRAAGFRAAGFAAPRFPAPGDGARVPGAFLFFRGAAISFPKFPCLAATDFEES